MLNYLHSYHEKSFANKICCALFYKLFPILVDTFTKQEAISNIIYAVQNFRNFCC